jgi:hypothetical protein
MIPLPGLVIRNNDFSATAAFDGKVVRAKLSGSAEMSITKELDSFVRGVHEAVLRYKTQPLLDLSELEFMNSSCLKCFVSLIDTVQSAAPGDRYIIRFLTNPKKHWQSRSLAALAAFGPELVKIEQ